MLPHQRGIIDITPTAQKQKKTGANFIKIEQIVHVHTSQDQSCH